MESTPKNILSVVTLILVFLCGGMIYLQQREITDLKIDIKEMVDKQKTLVVGLGGIDQGAPSIVEDVLLASGKVEAINGGTVSFKLKILNGKTFNDPLKIVVAEITDDTHIKIFNETKYGKERAINNLEDGTTSDLMVGARADFYAKDWAGVDRFTAERIIILK